MATSNSAIGAMIGQEVKVWSVSGESYYTDEGILEAFDHPWLRLRNSDDELLCLSVYRVRLVKVL